MFENDLIKEDIEIRCNWRRYIEMTADWDCSKIRNFIQVRNSHLVGQQ